MENWKARLKDGREIALRLMGRNDRERLLHLFSTMSEKALQWGMPPYTDERIDRWMSSIDRLIPLIAVHKDQIVGYAAILKRPHPRERGVGDMGIYLHQDFHNVGLGTMMSERILRMAEEQGLHRITLHVVEDNVAAVKLYKKLGFVVEGTLVDAYYGDDGEYHNMLVMGVVFPRS